MTTPRWPWADRKAIDTRESGAGQDSRRAASPQTAVLIGFPRGLEDALSVVLAGHYTVVTTSSPIKAIELLAERSVNLLIASGRCSVASVVKLTEALGRPREARVIILLAGRDPEAERRYREAGLRYVMHMPVKVEDLIRVAGSLPEAQS